MAMYKGKWESKSYNLKDSVVGHLSSTDYYSGQIEAAEEKIENLIRLNAELIDLLVKSNHISPESIAKILRLEVAEEITNEEL